MGTDELISSGVAFFAPIDTKMPLLDPTTKSAPEGFKQLTITEMMRMDPRNRVQVRLEAADGTTVAEYDAAATRGQTESGRYEWRALIAGCLTYELSFDLGNNGPTSPRCEVVAAQLTTNRMALAKLRFEQEVMRSTAMLFIVAGKEFFSLAIPEATSADTSATQISIESLEDLLAIEAITGSELPLATGTATIRQRAVLRTTRLLWEGEYSKAWRPSDIAVRGQ
ncbi:hypothetical protein ACQ3I4_16640 [Zafaria sp. Z1313]|uniref:hypothetical protein n=1 Tax=unclassified Zafaria TaxID=2828765 RepID=UPI002E77FAE5|nr:hypothetical protein [Zafaria sp. J156]MEE1622497.1 hypothetical protein [Zafaria sp. J156]